jgi:hypothetical protein
MAQPCGKIFGRGEKIDDASTLDELRINEVQGGRIPHPQKNSGFL